MSYLKFVAFNLAILLFGGYGLNRLAVLTRDFITRHGDVVPDWAHGSDTFITEVSLALTIAALLNLLVEWFTRSHHEQLSQQIVEKTTTEISKELLRSVFKKNLPASVVAQIESQLFSGHICKVIWETTYTLKLVADPDDATKKIVTWHCHDDYTLRNMDRVKRSHAVTVELEAAKHYEKLWKITKLQIAGRIITPNVTIDGLRSRIQEDIELRPGNEVKVQSVQLGAGPPEFHEVICSVLPVDELIVNVLHPEEMKVSAMSLHPEAEQLEVDEPERKRWRMRGVFPGQGLDIIWSATV